MPRLILSILLLISTLNFAQKSNSSLDKTHFEHSALDTTAYLKKINDVADSLRDLGDYTFCLNHFKKGLELYPGTLEIDYAQFNHSDTVYTFDYNVPNELFFRSNY